MKTVQHIQGDGVTGDGRFAKLLTRTVRVCGTRKIFEIQRHPVTRHPIEVISHDGMTAMTTYFQNSSRVPRVCAVRTEFFSFSLSCRHAVILCPGYKQMLNQGFRHCKPWV